MALGVERRTQLRHRARRELRLVAHWLDRELGRRYLLQLDPQRRTRQLSQPQAVGGALARTHAGRRLAGECELRARQPARVPGERGAQQQIPAQHPG
jgi:hypothetical protein